MEFLGKLAILLLLIVALPFFLAWKVCGGVEVALLRSVDRVVPTRPIASSVYREAVEKAWSNSTVIWQFYLLESPDGMLESPGTAERITDGEYLNDCDRYGTTEGLAAAGALAEQMRISLANSIEIRGWKVFLAYNRSLDRRCSTAYVLFRSKMPEVRNNDDSVFKIELHTLDNGKTWHYYSASYLLAVGAGWNLEQPCYDRCEPLAQKIRATNNQPR